MKNISLLLMVLLCTIFTMHAVCQSSKAKPRTIVTTDGEVDDQDSFIRLLLYANEMNIVGLIYSSSQWHYKGDGKGTTFTSELEYTAKRYGQQTALRWPGTTWMQEMIAKYEQVYPNLKKNADGYPAPAKLLQLVKVGNIDFEGEMEKDTEGSDYIKQLLLDSDTTPLYIQVWGGTNTFARALKSIAEQYKSTSEWKSILQRVSAKAIIYAVLDQDATYKKYIAPNWPAIKVLYNADQFWNFAYPWPKVVPDSLKPYLGGKWFKENIKFDHGPLLANYYLWGDGSMIAGDPEHSQGDMAVATKEGFAQYDFLSEGDSPAFFHLVDVGLRNLEDASYGGWGGRMVQSKTNTNRWEDGNDVMDFNPYTKKYDKAYPQTRWINVLQNDFAARADWCVKEPLAANHAPVVTLGNAENLSSKKGNRVNLLGKATDPDGNAVNYRWWQYEEVDSYKGIVSIQQGSQAKAFFTVPADAKPGDTIHIVLEVSDNGKPVLTRYRRVIVTVTE